MARPTFSELHPVGAPLMTVVAMERLVTPQAFLVRGAVAYHALLAVICKTQHCLRKIDTVLLAYYQTSLAGIELE